MEVAVLMLPRAAGLLAEFAPAIGGLAFAGASWLYGKHIVRRYRDTQTPAE